MTNVEYFTTLYRATHDGERISASDLIADEDLKFIHGCVEDDNEGNEDLQLTRDGLIATETLFRKFLPYMKEGNPDKLDTWINTLQRHKNSI